MQLTVNQRIKFLADKKGYTQYRLAKIIGVTSPTYLVKQQARHKTISSTEKYLQITNLDKLLDAIK